MHKTGNVLNYLPKSSQPKAKQGLHEIWMAETKDGVQPARYSDRPFEDKKSVRNGFNDSPLRCVSRQSMLSMIYKMGMCAEQSWRRLRGFRQLAKVIEGVKFNDGIEVVEDSRAAA